jgi:glycosyltransferase involved in cell wall biosynthesis
MVFYEENPQGITKTDIVVGIPTLNEAKTIGNTVEQCAKGLHEHFGNLNSIIVNCDNQSVDGTKDAFFAARSDIPRMYVSTQPGEAGKGNNLRNLFEVVRKLEAQAVVVLEADIGNLAPPWIKKLVEPVLKGIGYVTPLYVRHKYEATLSSSVIYPLTRCLYGRRVRQPNAGDCAFKGALVDSFLGSPVWTDAVKHSGIDIWMTTIALNARIPVSQCFMGVPKVHRVKDPYAHLASMFRQIMSATFDLMEVYVDFWRLVKWSKPTALSGTDTEDVETPLPVEVNINRLHERFVQGFDSYHGVWEKMFDQTVSHKLSEIRELGLQHFSIPTQTWARILFDASILYHRAEESQRMNLLDSLLPLYLGRVLTFVKKTERMSVQQAEDYVESDCTIFEECKPHLIKIWE